MSRPDLGSRTFADAAQVAAMTVADAPSRDVGEERDTWLDDAPVTPTLTLAELADALRRAQEGTR